MRRRNVFIVSFMQMLFQIRQEPMLILSMITPVIAGAAFRFGIPQLEKMMINQFHMQECVTPYYQLFDLLLVLLAPTMFCFASAMVILMEVDDKIAMYYFITPLGRRGYLIGRLCIPSLLGGGYSFLILLAFHLTPVYVDTIVIHVILGAIISSIVSLMIVAIASNKVEGMAVTKLSGLILVGIVVPFFVQPPYQYMAAFLPSYWLAKYTLSQNLWYVMITIGIASIWIYGLATRFQKKISG